MSVETPERETKSTGKLIPKKLEERIKRGRKAMMKDAPARRVAYKFWTGDHYWWVNEKNMLQWWPTVGPAKPDHRIRGTYPFIAMLTEAKISASTQKVPGYEVTPSTGDQADEEAALQAAQVAAYLYDKIGVRRATTKVVTNALVQREGFCLPYWDQNVGPYEEKVNLETGETEMVGRGEVRLLTLSRSEVAWEPGVDFDESRWHAIIRAQVVDEVKELPGYKGGYLKADASIRDVPTDRDESNMAETIEYFERPCPDYPNGRRLLFAGGREIVPEEEYPAIGPDGKVKDEPCIHRLSYTVNPEGDDQGLVERGLDCQRTIDDCWSKLREWKNRTLNPQWIAPIGAFRKGTTQWGDVPGAIKYFNGNLKPEQERPIPVPRELFEMLQQAKEDLRALFSDVDVQAEADLAAKTVSAAVEQSQQRWQSFLGDLAEFHSRLMRHCLSLVAHYYTEEREIELQGDYAPETLPNFTGQDLRSQVNIRVPPGSLESVSRQQIRADVEFVVGAFPGAIKPEAAIAAIQGGTGKNMLTSYKNHISRAWRMVRLCEQGMEALSQIPDRFDKDVPATDPTGQPIYQTGPDGIPILDPMTGQPMPVLGMDVPGWMPRKQDNIDIWQQVFSDAMTTPRFEKFDPATQHVFDLVWDGLENIKQQRAQAEMMQRDMSAAGQGLDNAAKPQMAPPLPDRSATNPK